MGRTTSVGGCGVVTTHHVRGYSPDGIEVVRWSDPRWAKLGLSHRRVGWWTARGYLRTTDRLWKGSGSPRFWPVDEIEVAARMVELIGVGLTAGAAAVLARADVDLDPLFAIARKAGL